MLNIVHDFLRDRHLDEEMQLLIQANHNFDRFIYSTMIHIILQHKRNTHSGMLSEKNIVSGKEMRLEYG